ncbi:hypothetical protein EHQ89_07765 [Leptospira biflexa]|nr:hypothetical protein EHQ89_07765 [Leptospira biflexa]TGM39894.1 hypothetical protein EHQ80_01460 [Leptospira biflexa]
MKTHVLFLLLIMYLEVSCQSTRRNDSFISKDKITKSSITLQYEMDLPSKVLKVGPNLEISIGKFALHSFNSLATEIFNVSSYKARNENDPLEPGTIVLRKVQVDRSLVFEEGTTKFQHATFASIVEFLLVKDTGESFRILGKSHPIRINTIPFSPNDRESEETIEASIRSAIEMGLRKIVASKENGSIESNQVMFQQKIELRD